MRTLSRSGWPVVIGLVALVAGAAVAACGRREAASAAPRVASADVAGAGAGAGTQAGRAAFPEVCGAEADALVCARGRTLVPEGTVLDAPVLEIVTVEREMPGYETKLAVRTDAGWFELPFVVERTPPCEGEAQVASVVEARVTGGVLLLRMQTARFEQGPATTGDTPGRELEENAYACSFEGGAPSCTRFRTATAPDGAPRRSPLARAAWRRERNVHVDDRGRVAVEELTRPATR